jgi:hypothetical protein
MGAESGRFIGRLISSRNQTKESNKRLADIAKKAASGDSAAQRVIESISRDKARFQQGMINKISTGKRTRNAGIIGAAVGASIPVAQAGNLIVSGLNKKFSNKFINSEISAPDNEAVKNKLKQVAKKQGIKIVDIPSNANSFYTGHKSPSRKFTAWGIKKIRKSGGVPIETERAIDSFKSRMEYGSKYGKTGFKYEGKDAILLGGFDKKSILGSAPTLAHELGHAQYGKSGRSKNIIAKTAHKLYGVDPLVHSKIGNATMFANGLHSGIKLEKLRSEGKKESTWNKIKSVAIPAALVAPVLVAEGAASLKGLKMMKNVGASKELMRQSRKALGNAYGTYLTRAVGPVISGVGGHAAGKIAGKAIYRNKGPKNSGDKK